MTCPFCGGKLQERLDVVGRALQDSVSLPTGEFVAMELKPVDTRVFECAECGCSVSTKPDVYFTYDENAWFDK